MSLSDCEDLDVSKLAKNVLPPLLLLVAFLSTWESVVWLLKIPAITLPPPSRIALAAYKNADELVIATGYTALASTCGLLCSVVIGVVMAAIFSQAAIIRRSFFPYAIFLQTVPIVAVAPLLLHWFGNGLQTIVMIVIIISLFPIIVNVTYGMVSVDRQLVNLFQLNRASRWQIFFKLQLPNSVPLLISATKTSAGLAVIGAIVGEFFAGLSTPLSGLGYFIMKSLEYKIDAMMAAVIASALLGNAMFTVISFIESKILARFGQVQSNVFQ